MNLPQTTRSKGLIQSENKTISSEWITLIKDLKFNTVKRLHKIIHLEQLLIRSNKDTDISYTQITKYKTILSNLICILICIAVGKEMSGKF